MFFEFFYCFSKEENATNQHFGRLQGGSRFFRLFLILLDGGGDFFNRIVRDLLFESNLGPRHIFSRRDIFLAAIAFLLLVLAFIFRCTGRLKEQKTIQKPSLHLVEAQLDNFCYILKASDN